MIEAVTYRMGAHSTSDDPSQYRSEEEVAKWGKKCPILRLRSYLESQNLWSDEKEEALFSEVESELNGGHAESERDPPPPLNR